MNNSRSSQPCQKQHENKPVHEKERIAAHVIARNVVTWQFAGHGTSVGVYLPASSSLRAQRGNPCSRPFKQQEWPRRAIRRHDDGLQVRPWFVSCADKAQTQTLPVAATTAGNHGGQPRQTGQDTASHT